MKLVNLQLSRSWHFFLTIIIAYLIFYTPTSAQIQEAGTVATPDSHATQIAFDILNQGGSAIDASVAAMFALSVVHPHASGIGGGGIMLIWMNQQNKATVIDFREQAPYRTDPSIFYQDSVNFNIYTKYGYRSICVPGMVAGISKALDLYGSMTLNQVLKPVIDLAKNGFGVSEALATIVTDNYSILETNRVSSQLFLPDWFPIAKDQLFARQDLAVTLNLLATAGPKAFYQGEIATEIGNELQRNNGIFQLSDFQNYQARMSQPIEGTYRGLKLLTSPPPSSGGTALAELLLILEQANLKQYKLNSGPYIHLVAEAMKQVFDDREQYFLGDPKFDRLNPQSVLSENHIKKCYNQIDSSSVRSILNRMKARTSQESGNGSHISIVDKNGNAVSISTTLNGFFGSGVTIPKYGILLNNAMSNFSADSSTNNSFAPGKCPQTSLAPTLVLKNQKPYLILGGSGAERIISMLAQIIINVVDFNLPLEEAVLAPRFHYNYFNDTIEMETRIEANEIEYLKKLGHEIELTKDFDVYFGSAEGILVDPINHRSTAVNDVRQEGVVYIR